MAIRIDQLTPSNSESINIIIKANLNAQVQVEPCYEHTEKGIRYFIWKKDSVVSSDNVGIKPLIVPTDTVKLRTITPTTRATPAIAMSGIIRASQCLVHCLHLDVPSTWLKLV